MAKEKAAKEAKERQAREEAEKKAAKAAQLAALDAGLEAQKLQKERATAIADAAAATRG